MYCNKCGNELDKNSTFCGKCGKPIKGEKNRKKIDLSFLRRKIVIIPCIVVIGLIFVYMISFYIGKNNLANNIIKDWSRFETGDSDSLYKLELDFSQDEIDYNFISSYSFLNTTLATFEYKVVSPSEIEVNNTKYKIEFDDDKTMMTITPALTSTDSSEYWFYYD